MGIRFRASRPETVAELGMPAGAADVLGIFPDSPAETAGFELGDVILGPPGQPFTEPNQVRSWTMLSEAGRPRVLEILRAGKRRRITLTPAPYPMKFPELPGPPEVGSAAPPLNLVSYRGNPPKIADGKPRLLVFWATWCAPCKAALPELQAYADATGTEIIAITDETSKALDRFFDGGQEYAENIAIDEFRRAYLAYGVSGTPTFVLVDGAGKIVSYSTGYSQEKSLGIPDWTWSRAAK
jgi:thiol-disulfide isomerase/thioredoxin